MGFTASGRVSKWSKAFASRNGLAQYADDIHTVARMAFEYDTTLSEAYRSSLPNGASPNDVLLGAFTPKVEAQFKVVAAKCRTIGSSPVTPDTATGAALTSAMSRVREYQVLIQRETELEAKLSEVRRKLDAYKPIAAALQRVIDAERALKESGV